jgi:hypothetical protein
MVLDETWYSRKQDSTKGDTRGFNISHRCALTSYGQFSVTLGGIHGIKITSRRLTTTLSLVIVFNSIDIRVIYCQQTLCAMLLKFVP